MVDNSLKKFYSGKNIFLTGGTGFVGLCLIEKFLRLIPDVGTIYILMRPKKGKNITERLAEIKENSVFDKLKELNQETPDILEQLFSKLYPIAGDVGEEDLGLCPTDRALLRENVNIVFHSAATLDFEANLKVTVNVNLLGTRRITDLCAQIQNLDCLVHISSAYVNSFKLHAEEVMYPLFEDPEKVIKMVSELSDDELEKVTPELLGLHPNTYTFTKHMAEHEVQKYEARYPCAIVRPSQINGAWLEPMPGWTVSKNGPQGFIMGAAKGVIRRLPMPTNIICDYIPVDVVINTLIVAAAHAALLRPDKVEIYHATSSTRKPFTWGLVEDKINGYLHRYPLKSAVWYPYFKLLPTYTWFRISVLFVHILPAFLLDGVTRLTGGRPILMKLHRNVNKSIALLSKFIFTEWTFAADRTAALQRWLAAEDAVHFSTSIDTLDWRNYFIALTQGVRRYLCGERPDSLAVARTKHTVLYAVHVAVQALLYVAVWWAAAAALGATLAATYLVLPVVYLLFSLL